MSRDRHGKARYQSIVHEDFLARYVFTDDEIAAAQTDAMVDLDSVTENLRMN